MHKGFVLENLEISQQSIRKGQLMQNEYSHQISDFLEKMIFDYPVNDGNEIMNNYFSTVNADIFLSHSHTDLNLALAVAGLLKDKFDLNTFVDTLVWGSANDLLSKFDHKYSVSDIDSKYFDYTKRNFSTSHIHNMLLVAITKMIDKAECFIFLKTKNSMPHKLGVEDRTLSPWVFSEIEISRIIEKRPIVRDKNYTKRMNESLNISYAPNMGHLKILDTNGFMNIVNLSIDKEDFLDNLYELHSCIQRNI